MPGFTCSPETNTNPGVREDPTPHLVDATAEAEVLSSVVLSEDPEKLKQLHLKDFVFPETKAIYRILRQMGKKGEPLDLPGVLRHCVEKGMEREVALEILHFSPAAALFPHQLCRLKEFSNKRAVFKLTEKLNQGKITLEQFQQFIQKLSTPGRDLEVSEFFQSPQIDEKVEIDWVVPDLIPRGYLTWLFGYPKTGKSWLALRLACDISTGGEILEGFCTTKEGRVLYILGDTDKRQPLYRLSKTNWRFNSENLKFVYLNELEKKGLDLDLSSDEGKKLLEILLKAYSADLVIIDSLSSFVSGDLMSDKEAKPIAIYLNQIAQKYDIGLLVLHHSRKPKKESENAQISQHDLTGSGALTRFSAVTIGVELKEKKQTLQKIHFVRFLGGWFPEFPTFSFWLEDEFNEEREGEHTSMFFDRNPEGKNIKETVLTTIKNKFSDREFTREELMTELPCEISQEWLRKIISGLVKQNIITKIGNTKNAKYFFTKEGEKQYLNELETALHKEKDLGIDLSIPPKIIPKSPNDLGIPEGQYTNQYANSDSLPTGLSGGLEYSTPLNTPENFLKPEKVANSPSGESLPPEQISRCKYCGEPITWGQDAETNQWLPMRPDYKDFHNCRKEAKY